ncbi:hypothetical protein Misp01_69500 [Microtetraspora sp. NBRC 13810]|uniref:MFS transporter n=1 Tax=Microtetraspora sp. NBRC 13810 TaxID=3030990 RepID=UPI0024A51A61|nr:MFS transporter [Microtetraspora sp. NBRC 13810]GLW11822.1 hypothetical protein Misp01_69500 [Microtetraspora sp. NBRC 13810]
MTLTAVEAPPRIFGRSLRALSVGLTAFIALVAFEYLAVATAMPVVGRELDGMALYGLAFSGAAAAGLIAGVLGGRWSDTRGPVAPLWTGVAAFIGGLVVTGTASSMEVFVAGRFVQGFGGGLFQVALYVLIARVYPAEMHPRVFSLTSAAWVVPSMVGPAITGAVTVSLGWRWVFLAVPVLALPAALLMWRGLAAAGRAALNRQDGEQDEDTVRTPIRARLGWAVVAAMGAALMQYGGGLREEGLPLLAAGIVVLAVALPRLLPRGTLRAARGLPAVIALRGIVAGAFMGAEVLVPLMLTTLRGLSEGAAGIVLTGGALTWSLGSWIAGRREGDRVVVLRSGSALIGAGIVVMALTASPAVPIWLAYPAWAVAGLGIGLVYPVLSVLVLELSGPAEKGENTASLGVGESVYTVVAIAVTGAALAALGTSMPIFALCLALPVLMALAGVLVGGQGTGPGVRRRLAQTGSGGHHGYRKAFADRVIRGSSAARAGNRGLQARPAVRQAAGEHPRPADRLRRDDRMGRGRGAAAPRKGVGGA